MLNSLCLLGMRPYVVIVLVTAGLLGCSQKPVGPKSAPSSTIEPTASIDAAREALRKSNTDLDGYRHALEQLSAAAARRSDQKIMPLSAEDINFLKSKLRFTNADIADVQRSDFGPLDAQIVQQAMLFRDIARTLDVERGTPREKAEAALDWTVRHVRLETRDGPSDPPGLVVARGRGTVAERTYVYAMLLERIGLPAFILADDSGDPSRTWGVGVWIDGTWMIFDTRVGLPLVGGLADLASQNKQLGELGVNWPGAASRAFVGRSVGLFAPRYQLVDAALPEREAKLSTNVGDLRAEADKLSLTGWSPIPGAPTRVLAEYLPTEAGGTDRPDGNRPSRAVINRSLLLPWTVLPKSIMALPGPIGEHLRSAFADVAGVEQEPGIADRVQQQQKRFETLRNLQSQERELPSDANLQADLLRELSTFKRSGEELQGPTLSDLLIRGRSEEANKTIVALETQMRTLRNKSDTSVTPAFIDRWVKDVLAAYADGARAQQSGNQAALDEINKRLNTLAQDIRGIESYVRWLAAGQVQARLAYLTAVSKHDQAAARARRDNNPATWRTAIAAWQSFLNNHADAPEAAHARRFLGIALKNAGQQDAGIAELQKAAGQATNPYDRAASAWLAKQ